MKIRLGQLCALAHTGREGPGRRRLVVSGRRPPVSLLSDPGLATPTLGRCGDGVALPVWRALVGPTSAYAADASRTCPTGRRVPTAISATATRLRRRRRVPRARRSMCDDGNPCTDDLCDARARLRPREEQAIRARRQRLHHRRRLQRRARASAARRPAAARSCQPIATIPDRRRHLRGTTSGTGIGRRQLRIDRGVARARLPLDAHELRDRP